MKTSFFVLKSGFYDNVKYSVWSYVVKLVPLYMSMIWFLTCRYWWHHFLIIPIGMYIFQFSSAINDDYQHFDEVEFKFVIPLILIQMGILYYTRKKMKKYLLVLDVKEQIENEIEILKKETNQNAL